MKHEKDNRKRIEYDAIGNILDEDFARLLENEVKVFVNNICTGIGKDYLRQDLKSLIMDYVNIAISKIQIHESYMYLLQAEEKNKKENDENE